MQFWACLQNGLVIDINLKERESLFFKTPKNSQMQNSETLPVKHQETISELAERHMKDPNHVTTDEEIKNAVVVVEGASNPPEDLEKLIEGSDKTVLPPIFKSDEDRVDNRPETDEYENTNDGFPNPYNVLK